MYKIAFIGLGAMGSRMAEQLVKAGHQLTVWNRTPEKADKLVKSGVILAKTPKEAAETADFVFSMVRDDKASEYVWLDAQDGVVNASNKNFVAIECSTLSISYIKYLSEKLSRYSIPFLDAPLAGSRPQAEAAKLIFVVGGHREVFEKVQSLFKVMGSSAHYMGTNSSGAATKLLINGLFGIQLAAMAELLSLGKKLGLNLEEAIRAIANTPVCSLAAKLSAESMLTNSFNPAFPIDLVAKDFGLIDQAAEETLSSAPISKSALFVYKEAIAQGYAQDNITGIIQLYK